MRKVIVLPKFSLQPNKITSFNEVYISNLYNADGSRKKLPNGPKGIKRQFHNFQISENAYRTLKSKITWLYHYAKPRYIKTYSGREMFNFKICFLTLTLPSKQKHPTNVITKECFNQFITEIRQRTKMQNFVWRLEFQKNSNVHYHLVTDTYLDYFLAQKIWNRIINKLGYVDLYTAKFKNVNLAKYNQLTNQNSKTPFHVVARRYAKGKKTKWSQPNSVDVKSVMHSKAIANYISKYFGKNANEKQKCNPLDNEGNSKSIRLWFCSRSLSRLKSISDYVEAVPYDLFNTFVAEKVGKRYNHTYASQIYFEIKELIANTRKFVEILFKNYAKEQNYTPALLSVIPSHPPDY